MPKLPWNSSEYDPNEFRLSLIGHLEELRNRIIRSLGAFLICSVVGWFLVEPVNANIRGIAKGSIEPVLKARGQKYEEIFTSFASPFMVQLKLAIAIGLTIAIPYIVFQLWAFIAPGLKPEEQKPFRRLAPISALLFVIGAGFAYLILPQALGWFAEQMAAWPGVQLLQEAGSMTYFVLKMMTAFGVGFQLPLIVWGLGALNLLSADTLFKYWRHAITIIFIASAAITPSADPPSMLMMAVPLCVLFMISVYAVKFTQRKKKKGDFRFGDSEEETASSEFTKAEPEVDYTKPIEEGPIVAESSLINPVSTGALIAHGQLEEDLASAHSESVAEAVEPEATIEHPAHIPEGYDAPINTSEVPSPDAAYADYMAAHSDDWDPVKYIYGPDPRWEEARRMNGETDFDDQDSSEEPTVAPLDDPNGEPDFGPADTSEPTTNPEDDLRGGV